MNEEKFDLKPIFQIFALYIRLKSRDESAMVVGLIACVCSKAVFERAAILHSLMF